MAKLTSRDPADDKALGTVEIASRGAVDEALAVARQATSSWASLSIKERADILQRFRRILYDRREEAARLVSQESGKPLAEARMADVLTALETTRHLAKHAADALAPQKVGLANPLLWDRRSHVARHPLGVVGVIAPWNYPLAIPATGVLSALVAGNTVVVKPSEETPLIGQWLVDRLHEAGVPAEALQVVHGRGDVGAALVAGDTDGILFTGSVETGAKVAAGCAPRFAPAVLELGGKDPMVVLEQAAFDVVRAGALWGAFTNAGQTCAAVERLYVPEPDHDRYVAALAKDAGELRLGHGLEPGTQMGPLINDAALKRVQAHIKDAEKRGAQVLVGGEVREELGPRFVAPTVLSEVNHDMTVMQDETFGPVLPIQSYADVDEAVHLANDSRYGLSASVWGPKDAARAVGGRLHAGTVTINDCLYTYAAPETPWGGWKGSGIGASHGTWGLEAVTRWQHSHEAPAKRGRSPWYYPYDAELDRFLDGGMRYLHGSAKDKVGAGAALKGWLRRR